MKYMVSVLGLACLLIGTVPLTSGQKATSFDIQRPTAVAFFCPATHSEPLRDADTNEALADFQLYAAQVREPLERRGIDFKVAYTHSFRIRIGNAVTTFRPDKVGIGYYLVAPGKKPLIAYGVMTGGDLLQVADEYFGVTRK